MTLFADLVSAATGGDFWDGLRQGLITSALNHALHAVSNAIKDPPTLGPTTDNYEQRLSSMRSRLESTISGFSLLSGYGSSSLELGTKLGIQTNFRNLRSYSLYRSNGRLSGNASVSGRRFLKVAKYVRGAAAVGVAASAFYDFSMARTTGNSGYLVRGAFSATANLIPYIGWGVSYGISRIPASNFSWTPTNHQVDWKNFCFIAGTKILMADGTEKDIETIEEGDSIMSVNMKTMKVEKDVVVLIPKTTELHRRIKITFEDGRHIVCSPQHPIFAIGKGWCVYDTYMAENYLTFEVSQLAEDDLVYIYDNGVLKKLRIQEVLDEGFEAPMYNVKFVKNNNTFFANGILVHNKFNN